MGQETHTGYTDSKVPEAFVMSFSLPGRKAVDHHQHLSAPAQTNAPSHSRWGALKSAAADCQALTRRAAHG